MDAKLKWKKSAVIAIVATVGLLGSVIAVALDCPDGNSETVIYEISSVEVNGEMTDSDEFGTGLEVTGDFNGVVVYAVEPAVSSRMVFEREGAQ